MAILNQGFRRDLNFEENTNDVAALNNLAGAGIADDLRIIQNNLRNISSVSYESLQNGFFFFGEDNDSVYTNDDIINVSKNINVGATTLLIDTDYYVCNSDTRTRFKLSTTPSNVGISTINVSSVSSTDFKFIRKEFVAQENINNFIKPQDISEDNFSYFDNKTINEAFLDTKNRVEYAQYIIDRKYKGNQDSTTNVDINVEGVITIDDPAQLNTSNIGLESPNSPGIFIGTVRAFSSDNNPWSKVGTALSTSSNEVSIGELYFDGDISITGISTEISTSILVSSYTHKIPVTINGEIYYVLLTT
jgi:hypothetical protein